jgi:hypothetical protein
MLGGRSCEWALASAGQAIELSWHQALRVGRVPSPLSDMERWGPACWGASASARALLARARAHAREAPWRSRVDSATTRAVSEHPSCAAVLHTQCRSVAVAGMEFCEHHTAVAAEHGAEAVKRGEHLPAPRKRVVQAAVVAEEAGPATINGGGLVDPSSVRPRLERPPPRSLTTHTSRRRAKAWASVVSTA